MAIKLKITDPTIYNAVQYNGDNLEELQSLGLPVRRETLDRLSTTYYAHPGLWNSTLVTGVWIIWEDGEEQDAAITDDVEVKKYYTEVQHNG